MVKSLGPFQNDIPKLYKYFIQETNCLNWLGFLTIDLTM